MRLKTLEEGNDEEKQKVAFMLPGEIPWKNWDTENWVVFAETPQNDRKVKSYENNDKLCFCLFAGYKQWDLCMYIYIYINLW